MKTYLALFVMVMLLGMEGCMSPRAVAYKSLTSVQMAVDNAMKLKADAWAAGKLSVANNAKIANLHDNKYQPAMRAALEAAHLDYSTAPPKALTDLALELITLINQIVNPPPKGT